MMSEKDLFFVLAFYRFIPIADPEKEIASHKLFFKDRCIASRIYISDQGINGQMSGKREDAEAYMNWMHANPLFEEIPFKIHTYHENVFPRQIVKYRKHLYHSPIQVEDVPQLDVPYLKLPYVP